MARRDAQREASEAQSERERHRETKEALRKAEEKQGELYQEVIKCNTNGVNRWNDIQHKYEEGVQI